MPRIDFTHAAVTHFREELQPDGSLVPYVPDDFGKVHAIVRDFLLGKESRDWQRISAFTETNFDGHYTAACDKIVRVVYTFPFNNERTEACPLCVERVRTYVESPEKYWREYAERRDRWRAKKTRAYEEWDRAEPISDEDLDEDQV